MAVVYMGEYFVADLEILQISEKLAKISF